MNTGFIFLPYRRIPRFAAYRFLHRITGWRRVEYFIPLGRHLQAFIIGQDAVPVEFGVGLVAIQFKKIRLVEGLALGDIHDK